MRRSARGGFSLLEAAVAIIIVGVGVAALLTASGAATRSNGAGRQLTQAVFLAQEIREWTVRLPFADPQTPSNPPGSDAGDAPGTFDDLDDLSNQTFTPPRDGQGAALSDFASWSQRITLSWRDPNNLSATVAPGGSDLVYVQVDILQQGCPVMTTGWLVARRDSP